MLTERQQEIARRIAAMNERNQRAMWTSFIKRWYPGLVGVPLETSNGLLLNTTTPLLPAGFQALPWVKKHLTLEMVTWGLDRIAPQHIVHTWERIEKSIVPEIAAVLGTPHGFAYLDASDGFAVPAAYWPNLIFGVSHESYLILPAMGFVLQFDPFLNLGEFELGIAKCP